MDELLLLRFQMGARVRAVGAVYYRVVGRAALRDKLFWFYYESTGPDVYVKAQLLGPVTVGGESNLFAIPYDADRRWRSGQYHAALPARRSPETVALELLDGGGRRLARLRYRLGAHGGSGSGGGSGTGGGSGSGSDAGPGGAGWGGDLIWCDDTGLGGGTGLGDGVGVRVDVRGPAGFGRLLHHAPWENRGAAARGGVVAA